jgi:predicted nucleotide-binding protein
VEPVESVGADRDDKVVPVSAVAEILLCDARQALVREVSVAAGRHDLQETFAAWLMPGNPYGLCMDGAVQAALTASGAGRTYREVAILGYAAHAARLDLAGQSTLAAWLRWLTAREPVVSNVPMPFCTDSVGLLGIALGARAVGDDGARQVVSSWLGRCIEARAGAGDERDDDVLPVAVEWTAGRTIEKHRLTDSSLADVRVALRSRGLLSDLKERSDDDEELDTLTLIQQETAPALGMVRASVRLAALNWLKAKKRQPPNLQPEGTNMAKKQADQGVDTRKVFVVHGRNNAAREALFTFLRAIGLRPLEWSEIVKATGKASPYIGEVLEKGFSIAQAVVVLMTPDDEARLREPYRGSAEPAHETELTPQPRPNVLLEGGMALGLFPDRTVIVELGSLRPVSDIGGRHVIRMNDTAERRHELAQRLETAGCEVNMTGTDWYKAGSFASSV